LGYGVVDFDIRFFDLKKNGAYQSRCNFHAFCVANNLPEVPVLGLNPCSLQELKDLAKGRSIVSGVTHIREGVVVKSYEERTDPRLGRVILKVINDDYLLGNFDEGGH